jgi:hypothetical protein
MKTGGAITTFLLVTGSVVFTAGQPPGTVLGTLQDPECSEISGIAASAIHPGTLYIHNDSGDTSRFFAVDSSGKLLSAFSFKGNSYYPKGVKDCEDIATGPGPDPHKRYIYLADIGDNLRIRFYVSIYRFEEPATLSKAASLDRQVIHLNYPDGPKDAETLLADPVSKSLYIISKREETVNIYSTPMQFRDNDTITLSKKGTLTVKGERPAKWIVSGDISPDGMQVLIKTLQSVYYWKCEPGEPLEKTLQRPPVELPYTPEKQGEAIGFAADGKGYYTVSEGEQSPILFYPAP